jgi:MerR family transcriptional regulator, copper efflux regulator
MQPTDAGDLVPIEEVARRFGLAASALRYYERRGLLQSASRHAGRRWYGRAELRRLAIIVFWQQSALMSLDQITALLDRPSTAGQWKQIVSERRQALDEQIEQMTLARDYLQHMLSCPRDDPSDDCPYFEQAIWQSRDQRRDAASVHREHHAARRESQPSTPRPSTEIAVLLSTATPVPAAGQNARWARYPGNPPLCHTRSPSITQHRRSLTASRRAASGARYWLMNTSRSATVP